MEEEFYDDEYNYFDSKIDELKGQLRNEVKQEIKNKIEILEKENTKINKENQKLIEENKQLNKQKTEDITLEMLRKNIKKSNIKELVSILLPKSNNSTLGMRKRTNLV